MTCVVDYSKQPPVFRCTVCGQTSPLSLPVEISQFAALGDLFNKQHRHCVEPTKSPSTTKE